MCVSGWGTPGRFGCSDPSCAHCAPLDRISLWWLAMMVIDSIAPIGLDTAGRHLAYRCELDQLACY